MEPFKVQRTKKDKRYATYGSRWGPGKVHRYVWNYENRVWYVACRKPYDDPYGKVVDSNTPVTCKKCLS